MPVRKYVNKAFRKGKRYAKKRYSTRTGGVRVNQLARDIYKIKRSLNVEHKHFDFKFGSGQSVSAFQPVNNDPIFEGVPLPTRGTSYNQRIGNQIRITNITLKLIMDFQNNQDLISRTTASVRLLFAKSGEDNPTIDELYDLDANGHYTRNSFVNTQNWKKYTWIKSLNSFKSHSDKVNRYDQSNSTASAYPENNSGGNQTIDVDDPANKAQYLAEYNKVSSQIDAAYRQMKLDTSRDAAKFETALPNLAEFESFYAEGGERDTLDIEMRNALLTVSPENYNMLELSNRRGALA